MFVKLFSSPFLFLLLIIPILPNLWAIWHSFRCEFNTPQEKMAWLAASVFLPVIGGIIYIIWGRRRGQKVI
mgnify:FL=1